MCKNLDLLQFTYQQPFWVKINNSTTTTAWAKLVANENFAIFFPPRGEQIVMWTTKILKNTFWTPIVVLPRNVNKQLTSTADFSSVKSSLPKLLCVSTTKYFFNFFLFLSSSFQHHWFVSCQKNLKISNCENPKFFKR